MATYLQQLDHAQDALRVRSFDAHVKRGLEMPVSRVDIDLGTEEQDPHKLMEAMEACMMEDGGSRQYRTSGTFGDDDNDITLRFCDPFH